MKIWHLFDTAVYRILSYIFRLNNKDYSAERHDSFMQFIKFCLVGVSNAVVYYVAYAGSLIIFRKASVFGGLDYQVSQIIGFVISVFWAFSINRKFVFSGEKDSYLISLCKFYITYAFTGLFMNSFLLFIWKEIGISEFIGPVINILFTTPVNFILSKKWTFKKGDGYNQE